MVSILVHYGSELFSQPIMTDDARCQMLCVLLTTSVLRWLLDQLLYLAEKEAYTLLHHKLFFILGSLYFNLLD